MKNHTNTHTHSHTHTQTHTHTHTHKHTHKHTHAPTIKQHLSAPNHYKVTTTTIHITNKTETNYRDKIVLRN